MLLTGVQAISVVVLTLVGLLSITYDPIGRRLTTFGWVLVVGGSFMFVVTAVVKEIEIRKAEGNVREQREEIHQLTKNTSQLTENTSALIKQIEELREKLYNLLASQAKISPKKVFPPTPMPTRQIRIKSPQDSSLVPARPYIQGMVSNQQVEVWVIVHPMQTSAYWVQPPVNVREDGSWTAMVYLGRASDIDVGKHFEIMAIGNPKKELSEGDVFEKWPEAQWNSHVIEVIRK